MQKARKTDNIPSNYKNVYLIIDKITQDMKKTAVKGHEKLQ